MIHVKSEQLWEDFRQNHRTHGLYFCLLADNFVIVLEHMKLVGGTDNFISVWKINNFQQNTLHGKCFSFSKPLIDADKKNQYL